MAPHSPKRYIFPPPPSYTTLEEVRAPINIPSIEQMSVNLVPSHLLERLEEYRADENKAFLLIGLFGGACLGIFSNWATNENFTITRASLVLLGILAMLTVFCAFWAFQINKRAKSVRERMLDYTILRAGENIIEPLPTENQDENPINKPQNTDSDSV